MMTNSDDVRKGVTNAVFNEEAFGKLAIQMFALSVFLGIYTESWFIFAFVLIGLIAVFVLFRSLAFIIVVGFSLGWGYIGYLIGSLFGLEASIVLGILALLVGLGTNWAGLEYAEDLG